MLCSCCSQLGKAGLLNNDEEERRQLLSQGSAEGLPPGERGVFQGRKAHVLLDAGQLIFLLQTRKALTVMLRETPKNGFLKQKMHTKTAKLLCQAFV